MSKDEVIKSLTAAAKLLEAAVAVMESGVGANREQFLAKEFVNRSQGLVGMAREMALPGVWN